MGVCMCVFESESSACHTPNAYNYTQDLKVYSYYACHLGGGGGAMHMATPTIWLVAR